MTPRWIDALLNSRAFDIFARIVLTAPFWAAVIEHGIAWNAWMGAMNHFNLHPPVLVGAFALVVCLIGTLLLVFTDKWAWLGAGALGVFTALTIPIAHDFWNMQGQAATNEFHTFVEHISIIGGLMVAAIVAARRARV